MDATRRPHLPHQVARGICGFDFPLVDDDHAVADHFDFGKDVGRNQHGVGLSEVTDELTNLANLVRVQTIGGFVEDQQLGIVHESIRKPDSLAVALGERLDHFSVHAGETANVDDFTDTSAGIVVA